LEKRMQERDTAATVRFSQIETKLEEHAVRLSDVPSTSQIVAAMDIALENHELSG